MTAVHHVRMQHPVGHGFFHTAAISTVNRTERDTFRYVYDCGSLSRHSDFRRLAIDTWLRSHPSPVSLDLVYISHMDIDHRSGLEQLAAGCDVATYILPLVDPVERVFAWAHQAVRDEFISDIDRQFVADPVGALRALSPNSRIIFVTPGGSETPEDWIPPSRDDPPVVDQVEPGELTAVMKAFEPQWEIDSGGPSSSGRPSVEMVRDTQPIVVTFPRTGDRWILNHYVDPGIVAHRDTFRRTLQTILGIDSAGLQALFFDVDLLGTMLQVSSATKAKNPIIRAYESIYKTKHRDLNLTSLCLYSGPHPSASTGGVNAGNRKARRGDEVAKMDKRVGWLGTGDAKLNVDRRIDPFLAKYAPYAHEVHTFTLPHHGSDHSLHESLLDRLRAPVYVGPGEGAKHPGNRVKSYLDARGITPYIVGKGDGHEERFCIDDPDASCGVWWSVRP